MNVTLADLWEWQIWRWSLSTALGRDKLGTGQGAVVNNWLLCGMRERSDISVVQLNWQSQGVFSGVLTACRAGLFFVFTSTRVFMSTQEFIQSPRGQRDSTVCKIIACRGPDSIPHTLFARHNPWAHLPCKKGKKQESIQLTDPLPFSPTPNRIWKPLKWMILLFPYQNVLWAFSTVCVDMYCV